MAFRVLSEKDLELLTESQREAYEEELAVYQERVKFVEQLERMENAQIEPYEPTLKSIPAIRKAPEKRIAKTERKAPVVCTVKKPVVNVALPEVKPIENPVLPKAVIPAAVRVAQVQKVVPAVAGLPTSDVVRVPARKVKALDPTKLEIQTVPKIRIPAAKQVTADNVKVKVGAAEKPVFKSIEKRVFEKVEATPCAVVVPPAKVRVPDVMVPVHNKPKLPDAAVAFTEIRDYHISVPEMTALPEAAEIRCTDISYNKPEISAASVAPAVRPVVPVKERRTVERVQPEIPVAIKVVDKQQSYAAPQIGKPNVSQTVQPVKAPNRTYKPVAQKRAEVAAPSSVTVPKKTVKEVVHNVEQLPQSVAITYPDPHSHEVLHALLMRAKKQ